MINDTEQIQIRTDSTHCREQDNYHMLFIQMQQKTNKTKKKTPKSFIFHLLTWDIRSIRTKVLEINCKQVGALNVFSQ